jgi:hypothetical protein
VRTRRPPPDLVDTVTLLWAVDDVMLVVCVDPGDDASLFLARPGPVQLPALADRAAELPRVIDEYLRDAIAEFGVPEMVITNEDARGCARTPPLSRRSRRPRCGSSWSVPRAALAQLVVPAEGPPRIHLSHRLSNPHARRFAIAHELGHYVMRHPPATASELCSSHPAGRGLGNAEHEANCFAVELLMPSPIVYPVARAAPLTLDLVTKARRPLPRAAHRRRDPGDGLHGAWRRRDPLRGKRRPLGARRAGASPSSSDKR